MSTIEGDQVSTEPAEAPSQTLPKPAENGASPFPMDSFKEAAPHLRRPYTAFAVKFKVQATWPKDNPHTGLVVPYIDARLVIDRLNTVIPHQWTARYEGNWCHLTIGAITRCDVGEGQGKALVSDSLKRAAKHFGIGVSLNAMPKVVLTVADKHLRKSGKQLLLTDEGEARCREIYAEWLDDMGIRSFGEPLDHGDALGSVGSPEEEQAEAPAAQLPVEGHDADVVRGHIADTYNKLREIDKGLVKPAEYAKWLSDSDHDIDLLRGLSERLDAKLAEAQGS